MVYQNILDAMGNTPTIQLNHMVPEGAARILVKFEGLNVGRLHQDENCLQHDLRR